MFVINYGGNSDIEFKYLLFRWLGKVGFTPLFEMNWPRMIYYSIFFILNLDNLFVNLD